MNPFRLGTRDQRALLLGLLVAAPVVAYRFGILPYVRILADARNELTVQRDLLLREMRVLDNAPRYPELTNEASAGLQEQTGRLFSGPDRLSATAALVNYVGTEARRHRVLVQQSETRVAQTVGGGVVELQISVRGLSDLHGLLEFFHALEEGPKLVRVDRVSIEGARRVVIGAAADEEVLSFSTVVSGYALSESDPGVAGIRVSTIGGGP